MEQHNFNILSKSHPSIAFLYDEETESWKMYESENASEYQNELNLESVDYPQKISANYLFVYDKNINDWRPMIKGDI
jgi:hypothetical protein